VREVGAALSPGSAARYPWLLNVGVFAGDGFLKRVLQTGFSVLMVVGGCYFLFLYLKAPTTHELVHNGAPGLFWLCLGTFFLWNDYLKGRGVPR
jgi:ABC-type sulfate transport system permease subunit